MMERMGRIRSSQWRTDSLQLLRIARRNIILFPILLVIFLLWLYSGPTTETIIANDKNKSNSQISFEEKTSIVMQNSKKKVC
jgi:hypothetical protein